MSPFGIYSKTGKGVQEASGKTNLLERADRAVLAMIDGRASVADLHDKFGRMPESQFFGVVEKLEVEGFIRQVSTGKPKEHAPARSAGGGTSPLDQGTDLDFTSLGASSISRPPQVDLAARARAEAERRGRDEVAANQARIEAEARARAQAEARARAEAEARARAQAEAKARAEAEARARLQAEARTRAERDAALKVAAEAKARAEAEARARAEAEARAKAAREGAVRAALEAKARAEAELTAKLDAERKAREELERKLKEQAERLASENRAAPKEAEGRVLSEVEELRQRLEEKRRAREEAERSAAGVGAQADDTVQRMRREADDLREELEEERQGRRLAERQVREDADRRTQEQADRRERVEAEQRVRDAADRRAQEEADDRARAEADSRAREEEDRRRALEDSSQRALKEADAADAERKRKEEEEQARRAAEEREWKEQAERMRLEQERAQREAEEEARKKEEARRATEEEERKKKFLETQTLFADLSAFSEKEVVARPDLPVPKPVAPAPAPAPEKKPAPAPVAPKPKEEAPIAKAPVGDEDLRRDLKLAKQKAREERRERRRGERGSDRSKDSRSVAAEAKPKPAKPKMPAIDWRKVGDRAQRVARKSGEAVALAGRQGTRIAKRSWQLTKRAYAAVQAYRRVRAERAEQVAKQKAKVRADARAAAAARGAPLPPVSAERQRRPTKWGASAAKGLVLLIVVAAGAIHVVPLDTAPYEKALSDAMGQPVRIGAARGWLITGPQIRFEQVKIGDGIRAGAVHASPDLLALLSGELSLGRVELEQAVIPQRQLGGLLFGVAKGSTLKGVRIVAHGATLEGPVKLPALDAEIVLGADGKVGTASMRGPDSLSAKLARKGSGLELEASADKFAVPFVPGLELAQFTLKSTATPQGLSVSAWDGVTLGGVLSGSANVRWADGWSVEGTLKARAMEAGTFAPALVSEGRTEGQGTYSMRAGDVSGLAATARIQGKFAIAKGVLAKLDLSRAVQTSGTQAGGRTPFLEMTGEGTYDRGAVLIRNARMVTGGALNAEANLDITPSGALSGNVIAELSGRAHALRTLVKLSGTLANPQVGNP